LLTFDSAARKRHFAYFFHSGLLVVVELNSPRKGINLFLSRFCC
jgi:hypothetical protein